MEVIWNSYQYLHPLLKLVRSSSTMKRFVIYYLIIILITIMQFKIHKCDVLSKCKEYGKAVYVQKDSPVLTMRHRKNDESECGIVSVPLVIGGTRASVKEFPHMAVIGFGITRKSKLSWDCGGALISDLYILTAAHCMESRELGPAQAVKLGIVDIEDENDLQERDIVEKIPHPRYARASKENDIALIKMDRPVEFTPTVRPACLNNNEIEINRKAFATGFGKLSYDADRGSRYLMKVTLTIYDSPPCAAALKSSFQKFVTETMLCAGEMKGGKDTCQGDSGGPLQIVMKEPYCMYGIIGITSYGKFCGFANSPAVYTKVSSYIPWIESIVWKDN